MPIRSIRDSNVQGGDESGSTSTGGIQIDRFWVEPRLSNVYKKGEAIQTVFVVYGGKIPGTITEYAEAHLFLLQFDQPILDMVAAADRRIEIGERDLIFFPTIQPSELEPGEYTLQILVDTKTDQEPLQWQTAIQILP